MLFINSLINSYKTIVSQGDDKPKVKIRESNSLPIVMGKSLTQLKIQSKFFLKSQFSTLVTRTEHISLLNPTSNLLSD